MENKQMLEEFLELVQIPVNSRNERQIADVLKAKLEALGLEVTAEDTGAKIVRRGFGTLPSCAALPMRFPAMQGFTTASCS